jgi:hypothetical protein
MISENTLGPEGGISGSGASWLAFGILTNLHVQ